MSYHHRCKKQNSVQSLKLTYKKCVDAAGCDPGKLNALYSWQNRVHVEAYRGTSECI